MDIFGKAVHQKLRFESQRGLLSTEDLFDLPMTGPVSLNSVAIAASRAIEEVGGENFVSSAAPVSPALKLRLKIVKAVIAERQALAAKRLEREKKAKQKDLILDLINEKDNEELRGKSREELLELLG